MTVRKTKDLTADTAGIESAAEVLSAGGLVAFPTETVYGLGADARNDLAVADIFAAKGRPSFNPLIVHVSSLTEAERFASFDEAALDLARAFWPGALTLVLPLRSDSGLSRLVTAGGDSLAIRVPDHPVASALLDAFQGPIAAPSANPSGRISPTTADHVRAGLRGRIDAIVDGGSTNVGLESAIVDPRGPFLLRPGGIPPEALEQALRTPLRTAPRQDQPSAPGQLASHYAPGATVRLDAEKRDEDEFLIGFGGIEGDLSLSPTSDLREAAARLFDVLHQADATGRPIAVAPVPDTGLGKAINDRLRRAAAPRSD